MSDDELYRLLARLFTHPRYSIDSSRVGTEGIYLVHDRLLESWCGIGRLSEDFDVQSREVDVLRMVSEACEKNARSYSADEAN